MRNLVCLIFFFIFTIASLSQEHADSSKTKLKVFASVSINSNGIAPIPSFSLDKPAVIASVSLMKNRFSYDPMLAYGFNMKPWIIDSWLHYKLVRRPAFELRTGVNFSSFFNNYKLQEEELLKGERYFAYEIAATYIFSPNNYLSLMYWNDRGQEPGTIKGHFINLVGDKSDIRIGKSLLTAVNVQLFYINYDGNNDGLFITPKFSVSIRNVPFILFFQATQAIDSNIEPWPGFRWNVGVSYTL